MRSLALLLLVLPYILAQVSYKTEFVGLSGSLIPVYPDRFYGLTEDGSVWQSLDKGKTFKMILHAQIRGIYPVPSKPGYVFLLGNFEPNGTSVSYWINDDVDPRPLPVRFEQRFTQVKLHPTEIDEILAVDELEWEAGYSPLYRISQAYGNPQVNKIHDKVYNYYHCFAGSGKNPVGRICAIADYSGAKPQRLVTSNNFGASWTTVIDATVTSYTEHWAYTLAIDSASQLWVSTNNATSFKKALFPADSRIYQIAPEQILDARNGSIVIGGHTGAPGWGTPNIGNVYVSDSSGTEFALAAAYVNTLNNWWDFAPVSGLEGFYLLNYALQFQNGQYVGPDGNIMLKTARTDNNLANVSLIRAPAGSHCNISDIWTCSLNLFGRTTWLGAGGGFYASPVSVWNDPGFIIATGNVGPFLNTTREAVNTYLSSDGGFTWTMIFSYATIYARSGYHGITVFVQNQVPISKVYYTTDNVNYHDFILDNGAEHTCITLINDGDDIFTLKCAGPIYFTLDFTMMTSPFCSKSDMDVFTPVNATCILGRKVAYYRRRPSVQCKLSPGFSPIDSITNCQCTPEDYECDMGFVRTRNSHTCSMYDLDQADPVLAGLCDGTQSTYYKSKGYRKIPGDSCTGDLGGQYAGTIEKCPTRSIFLSPDGGLSRGGVVAVMLLFMLIAAVGAFIGGIIAGHKSHHIRERVPKSWISVESHRLI